MIYEAGPGGGYSAYAPDLPGRVAAARTLEETRALMEEAIEFHIEGIRLHGRWWRAMSPDNSLEPERSALSVDIDVLHDREERVASAAPGQCGAISSDNPTVRQCTCNSSGTC